MKKQFRNTFVNFAALFLVSKLTNGINFSDNYITLFWAASLLTVLNLIIRPILNLILTPINLITLGAFRWVINVLIILMISLILPEFRIIKFAFPGFSYRGFVIPQISFSFFWALFLISFMIEIAREIIFWIFE